MPLYEYACAACAHEFEEMRKFSDPPLRKCPECGKPQIQKKISMAGFQLKGAGWYKDGYSKSAEKSDTKARPDKSEIKPAPDTPKKSGDGGSSSSKTAVA